MVAFSSCNSSIVSDDESIDGEGNGSGIDSPSREDDVANLYTEIGPPITPQQPFWAQELYTCHAGHLLNPSPARCIRCKGLLMGSFCLDCMLDGDPCGTLFDASHVTGNTKDYMDSPSGPIAPKHLCTHINLSDTSLVSTEKTVQESRQGIVEGWANIPDWEAMTPGHTQLATSSSAPLDGTRVSIRTLFMKETTNGMPVLSGCQNRPPSRATRSRLPAKTKEFTGLREQAFVYYMKRSLVVANQPVLSYFVARNWF